MYRKNISIVRGGPAPEAQLPAIKEAGWDGVFFTWTGGAADGALSAICRVHCMKNMQGQPGRMPWIYGETA